MPTLRETIEMLTALAHQSPDGLDTPVEFAICDGENLQMIDEIDLGTSTRVSARSAAKTSHFVLFRGHHHPGRPPGLLLRGAAADVDDELRGLTEPDV
ncbi:hypothetical protein [Actinocorallia longicatena]|uniref:Uncharacterized protein n=1 Tax=Actinocorallia longicatena TaxID=111803 RepID=A0ABP6QD32_9ACTN